MDTISRENSTSYLPVAGVILGVIGLIVGAAGFIKANSVGKRVPEDMQDQLARISTASDEARANAAASDKAVRSLTTSTQNAVDAIFGEINAVKASITTMQDAAKGGSAAKKNAEPVVAGPDEYVVQPNDTGYKIAGKLGIPFNALQEVNPTVDWNHMKPGQKLKVPVKGK